ncbi:hypothetical protein EB796_019934 [Bugula neritina]|uniref:Flavin-containing monooxygenase n=1 Tax=Bugula neritina TaxID=10212 RepID=A0A7J7J6H3_BUGNE|nr:hypothetical protein EB796_019934 [Bugula neritina]
MKEVVVIGAGPAGLSTIKSLSEYKDELNITAYEISDRIGGVWVNRDPYKHTATFDSLRANNTKEMLGHPDFPLPSDIQESFIPRSMVLDYLENFANHFQLKQFIKFRHTVLNVDILSSVNGVEKWNVMVRNEETGAVTNKKCDAVLVATGHETEMHIPEFEGMKTFTGEIIHTRYFQDSTYYIGKTVVLVGAGFSGLDIFTEIHAVAKKIYLSHHDERIKATLPENAEYVPDVARLDGDDIIFTDGRVVQADIILLATGYRYDFPFLSENCRPVVKDDHVTNIYRMMVDIEHPSLYYIGLNKLGMPFREFSMQADLATAFITGRIPAVSKEEMQKEYEERYKKYVTDPGLRPKDFHIVCLTQFEYADTIMEQSGRQKPGRVVSEKIYRRVMGNALKNFLKFKKSIYRLVDEENFEVVYEDPVYSKP